MKISEQFEMWWETIGSGMPPKENEEQIEHVYRVCKEFVKSLEPTSEKVEEQTQAEIISYREVSEEFDYEGITLKCVAQSGCIGCNFEHGYRCEMVRCDKHSRDDNTDVIFKKV